MVLNDADATWTVALAGAARVTADVVVRAIGMFNELARPPVPGLDEFTRTMFHSAEWR